MHSQGQAQAIFHLSEDGTELDFKLIASNIVDVTQSHIHCGLPGVNGPVVVFLYGLGPTVCRTACSARERSRTRT